MTCFFLHAQIDESSSLFAWDAMSLKLLYTSNNTDVCGGLPSTTTTGGVGPIVPVKFVAVTIASGSLYLACTDKVLVYSLV